MEESPATQKRIAWKSLLLGALVGLVAGSFGLAALILGAYAFFQKEAVNKMAEVKELKPLLLRADFNWSVTDLQGQPLDLNGFAGKNLFLHFWNPTCVSCLAEIPSLNALYESYEARGLAFAGVALGADENLAQDVALNDVRFPVYTVERKALPEVFNPRATPTTYIVDRHGFLALTHAGAVDWSSGDGAAFLDALVAR